MREAVICQQFSNIQEALDSEETTFGRVERFIAKMMAEEHITIKVEIIKRILKFFVDFNDYNIMIENFINMFAIITENETLQEIVNFTLFSARILNSDQTINAFDITELPKLFDLKTTEEGKQTKMLYHYIIKYGFKCKGAQNLAELQNSGKLQIFIDDEMHLLR